MLFEYIQSALKYAEYKKLEDNTWFAEIPNFAGVWANAKSIEECRTELAEVLEEWILLKSATTKRCLMWTALNRNERRGNSIPMLKPISRTTLIKKFKALGFKGPISGVSINS